MYKFYIQGKRLTIMQRGLSYVPGLYNNCLICVVWNGIDVKNIGRAFFQHLLGETEKAIQRNFSHDNSHPEREPNAGFPEEDTGVPTVNCEIRSVIDCRGVMYERFVTKLS
jgi:hypothetical protein